MPGLEVEVPLHVGTDVEFIHDVGILCPVACGGDEVIAGFDGLVLLQQHGGTNLGGTEER